MTGAGDLIKAAGGVIGKSFAIFVGLALLVFFWGLAKFVFRVGGDESAVKEGRNMMVWGLITLFVMLSIWGLVKLLQTNLVLPNTYSI